jgi:hypothetical protein
MADAQQSASYDLKADMVHKLTLLRVGLDGLSSKSTVLAHLSHPRKIAAMLYVESFDQHFSLA